MDINLDAKLYAGYAEQIEMIKQKQKKIGDEILAELEKVGTKKINIEELGTFSVTERKFWKYDSVVKDLKLTWQDAKTKFEAGIEPAKITTFLRFQRTTLDKNGKASQNI